MYKRALAGKERALGPEHTSTLDTVNNLGLLYRTQGKLDEAEQMYKRALAGEERKDRALGRDYASTLSMESTAIRHLETSDPGLTEGSTALTATELAISEAEKPRIGIRRADQDMEGAGFLDDDIASVCSIENDIAPVGPTRKDRNLKILEAEFILSRAFAKHKELAALCKDALTKVPRERFVDNFRRLLGIYYLDLIQESVSMTEKECVNVVEYPMARIHVASELADSIQSADQIGEGQSSTEAVREEQGTEAIERWLNLANEGYRTREGGPEVFPMHALTDDTVDEGQTEENESSGPFPPTQTPNIEEAKRFLFGGAAFQHLLCNTQMFLIPVQLASLRRVLMTVSSDNISFLKSQRLSTTDRAKVLLERICGSVWDWWPFQPPKRRLYDGYTRIQWQCVSQSPPSLVSPGSANAQQHCRMVLWQDVTEEQATALQNLIRLRGSVPQHSDHLCRDIFENRARNSTSNSKFLLTFGFLIAALLFGRVRNGDITTGLVIIFSALIGVRTTFASWKIWNLQPQDGINAIPLGRQHHKSPDLYSSLGDLASSTGTLQRMTNSDRQKAPEPSESNDTKSDADHPVGAHSVKIPAEERFWILFGVTGRFEYFEIDHVDTRPSKIKNDDDLFRSLRASHAQMKRLFRRIFSVWRLNHCDIIKVSYDKNCNVWVQVENLTFQVHKAGGESHLSRYQRSRSTVKRIYP
jgi:Tetratricopeptide repeat